KQKLVCMRALGAYDKAIYEYETAADSLKQENALINEISKTYYLINNYEKSIEILNSTQKALSDSMDLYQTEIMKATAFARINNFNEMNKSVCNATQTMRSNYRNTENLKLFNELQNIKTKNPKTAKWLSLFPGAGYLYAGHKGSAATSFLINGLLAYATYTSIKTENYGLAALTGFFNISFYIGNIVGAGKSARRTNEMNKLKTIRKIEHYNNLFNQ
ncbi:MAG: hypothetical protein II222_04635, partial [Paraprevotella sp.]|nr:hypothetical protein [Paraprevotella sp.]